MQWQVRAYADLDRSHWDAWTEHTLQMLGDDGATPYPASGLRVNSIYW